MSKRAEIVAREKEALKEQQQLLAAQGLVTNRPASCSSSASSVIAAVAAGVAAARATADGAASLSPSSCSVGSSLLTGSISAASVTDDAGSSTTSVHGQVPVEATAFPAPADGNNNLSGVDGGKAVVA